MFYRFCPRLYIIGIFLLLSWLLSVKNSIHKRTFSMHSIRSAGAFELVVFIYNPMSINANTMTPSKAVCCFIYWYWFMNYTYKKICDKFDLYDHFSYFFLRFFFEYCRLIKCFREFFWCFYRFHSVFFWYCYVIVVVVCTYIFFGAIKWNKKNGKEKRKKS